MSQDRSVPQLLSTIVCKNASGIPTKQFIVATHHDSTNTTAEYSQRLQLLNATKNTQFEGVVFVEEHSLVVLNEMLGNKREGGSL